MFSREVQNISDTTRCVRRCGLLQVRQGGSQILRGMLCHECGCAGLFTEFVTKPVVYNGDMSVLRGFQVEQLLQPELSVRRVK